VSRARWLAKKAARAALLGAAGGSGWLAVSEALRRRPRLRVLTYHRFAAIAQDPFALDPAVFAEQMAWLSGEGRAVGLDDLEAFLRGERALRDGSVLVTIDDGCRSTHERALPVLARERIPAVAFVTSSLVGRGAEGAGSPEPYMGWSELAELQAAGVAIGSHAHTHRSLGRLAPAEARDEARRSRELLGERLARPVRAFAYPFGTRSDYSAATREALAEAGYAFGFTSQHGAIRAGMDALELPRVKVESGEGPTLFRWLCRGGMDAWCAVDVLLSRTQQQRVEQAQSVREPK
jgi:peptidoglycan/xylan/chitin deacetylase (PgdA/CDA1 family)